MHVLQEHKNQLRGWGEEGESVSIGACNVDKMDDKHWVR